MNQAGSRTAEAGSQKGEPTRSTTKECNSRLHKHFGCWKRRCYNRLTESITNISSRFPARENIVRMRASWGNYLSAQTVINEDCKKIEDSKKDDLVRIIE